MTLKATDDEFIQAWKQTGGSATETAKVLGLGNVRAVFQRRRNIEKKLGHPLLSTHDKSPDKSVSLPPGRLAADIPNGTVLIGSDAHIWPGHRTTAQRAFLQFIETLKPALVVINGDLFDGATVSRHPAGMWAQEKRPNVQQELEACQDFMESVRKAARGAETIWTWGNHDARFEARLAALTPEYEGVKGFALRDHFPGWKMGMSLWVNDDVVIKHRAGAGGLHAVYQNTLKGGKTIITGHLHSLKVTPWTDYNGTRYGVDTGTLSDIDGAQFDYTEDNAKNWRSGFVLLTVADRKLLLPEIVQVWNENSVQFRGEIINV